MKLKKFLKLFHSDTMMVIWEVNQNENEKPLFEGTIFNIPYGLLNCRILEVDEDLSSESGIYLSHDLDGKNNPNPTFGHQPGLVLVVEE